MCGQLYLLTDGVFWSGSFMPVGMFVAFFGAEQCHLSGPPKLATHAKVKLDQRNKVLTFHGQERGG